VYIRPANFSKIKPSNMRKFLSLLPVLMLLSALALGQARTITGKVTNDKGEPVPFATVVVKGTKTSAVADANGVFKIEASQGAVLEISSAGSAIKQVTVGTSDMITVAIGTTNQMDEVVVTAQGCSP
jgi:hypothetical protein